MSDTNLNDASFTPEINDSEESTNKQTYSATGSFRFWCQKVLPLVYDDSLSYYELLCKVVNYLNNVIQNVDNLNTSVDNTNTAFNNLQNYVNATKDTLVEVYGELEQYVNDYFNNLDVQEEINSKLDSMAEDGSLSTIISPFIPSAVSDWLSENITPTSPAVDASLTISGAAADAKVTGELIRNTSSELNYKIDTFTEETDNINSAEMGRYYVSDTGIVRPASDNYICMKNKIPVIPSSGYTWNIFNHNATASIAYHVAWYDNSGTFISRETITRNYASPSVAQASPENAYFMCMDAYSTGGISSDAKIVIFHNDTIRPTEYLSPYSAIDLTARKFKAEIDNQLEGIEHHIDVISDPTVNINTEEQGRYYVSSSGTIQQSSDNYIGMLNKIPCNSNTDYTAKVFDYTGTQSLTLYFAYYDANGTFISRDSITKAISNLSWQITTPTNCEYMYFDAYASNGINSDAKILICKGTTSDLPNEYVAPYSAVDVVARDAIKKKYNIPSYFEENLLNGIARYRTNACDIGASGESFIFFTDVHIKSNQMHTPELIRYLIDNTNLTTTICGGDILDNYNSVEEAINAGFDYIKNFSNILGRVKTLIGNHDTNKNDNTSNPERWLSPNQLYSVYCSQSERDIENVHCIEPVNGYADVYYSYYVPATNTLYLFIGIPYGSVFDTQINWVVDMLTNNSDKNVILFSHYLINPDSKQFSGGTNNLINRIKGFQNLKGYVFGHVHYDHVMYMDTGIPMISVDTDSSKLHTSNPYSYTIGTITEQAFDIITADYAKRSLYCSRIGRGKNRYVNGGINSVTISGTTALSTRLTNATWSSDNTAIATVANGVVTGVASGNAIIKAYNDTNEEYWYVVVE